VAKKSASKAQRLATRPVSAAGVRENPAERPERDVAGRGTEGNELKRVTPPDYLLLGKKASKKKVLGK